MTFEEPHIKQTKHSIYNNKPLSAFTSKSTDTDGKNNMEPTEMFQIDHAVVKKFQCC